jgi:hypothetical protein
MPYRIRTKVRHIELKEKRLSSRKDPHSDNVIVEIVPLGWFVHFEGSYESIYVGREKPADLNVGMQVDILIIPQGEK